MTNRRNGQETDHDDFHQFYGLNTIYIYIYNDTSKAQITEGGMNCSRDILVV